MFGGICGAPRNLPGVWMGVGHGGGVTAASLR